MGVFRKCVNILLLEYIGNLKLTPCFAEERFLNLSG